MTESQQQEIGSRSSSEDQRLTRRTAGQIGARLRRYHAGPEAELPAMLSDLLKALDRAERRQRV